VIDAHRHVAHGTPIRRHVACALDTHDAGALSIVPVVPVVATVGHDVNVTTREWACCTDGANIIVAHANRAARALECAPHVARKARCTPSSLALGHRGRSCRDNTKGKIIAIPRVPGGGRQCRSLAALLGRRVPVSRASCTHDNDMSLSYDRLHGEETRHGGVPQTVPLSRCLYDATRALDLKTVQRLLALGADPLVEYRGRCALQEALETSRHCFRNNSGHLARVEAITDCLMSAIERNRKHKHGDDSNNKGSNEPPKYDAVTTTEFMPSYSDVTSCVVITGDGSYLSSEDRARKICVA